MVIQGYFLDASNMLAHTPNTNDLEIAEISQSLKKCEEYEDQVNIREGSDPERAESEDPQSS